MGDAPVATSFSGLNCNPYTSLVGGFSANSNGCGSDDSFGVRDSNENWCSDFAKWVWQRAGVTQDMNTINAAASSFYAWALDDGQNPQPDAGTPQPGDAIVFFGAGAITPTRYAQHVGIVSAVKAGSWFDLAAAAFAFIGLSIPSFWLGIVLIYIFAVYLQVLPAGGFTPLSNGIGANLQSMILPAIALGTFASTQLMRYLRATLLDVLHADYIRTARAKGLREQSVLLAHAVLLARGREPSRVWPDGVVVLATTYVVGMLLRALSGRGMAPGFLVVAGLFLLLTTLGWRVVLQVVASVRARRAA